MNKQQDQWSVSRVIESTYFGATLPLPTRCRPSYTRAQFQFQEWWLSADGHSRIEHEETQLSFFLFNRLIFRRLVQFRPRFPPQASEGESLGSDFYRPVPFLSHNQQCQNTEVVENEKTVAIYSNITHKSHIHSAWQIEPAESQQQGASFYYF